MAVDLENKITEGNKQIYESSGYSRDDLIGKSASLFLSKADYERILQKLEKNKDSGSPVHLECNIIKKDLSVYPAEFTIGFLQNSQGAPFGYVVMIRDLTEKKELEKKLFNSERLAAIGELASMVGHDLRNPLAAIKNAAYLLRKKGSSIQLEQAKTMLEIIEKGIAQSDKIINDLLDYSRNMHLDLQVCSVKNVLSDALAFVRVPENVKIFNTISEEPTFKIDKTKIERVFINLVKNAIDAMPNGGIITLTCKQLDNSIEITFSDTGFGIPEEILPKLFSPLLTTKAQGMGFGLAICKRIIDAHGGFIEVETEKGKGTVFKITLPIEAKQATDNKIDWIIVPERLLPTTKQ